MQLTHPESGAPLEYLYAAPSRRMGGLVLDVDLAPNHACNFRCQYCFVSDLTSGEGTELNLDQLGAELSTALAAVQDAAYLEKVGLPSDQPFAGLVLSGHGEPTNNFSFRDVCALVAEQVQGLEQRPRVALVTNGSEIPAKKSREGLTHLASIGAECWFKFDDPRRDVQRELNGSSIILRQVRNNLKVAAEALPTWLQAMLLVKDGAAPSEEDRAEYAAFVKSQIAARVPLAGVQLVTLSHPSRQPEAERFAKVSAEDAEAFAAPLRELGVEVRVHV
jgi:pyruvate-formate lyase-activating enzyme